MVKNKIFIIWSNYDSNKVEEFDLNPEGLKLAQERVVEIQNKIDKDDNGAGNLRIIQGMELVATVVQRVAEVTLEFKGI